MRLNDIRIGLRLNIVLSIVIIIIISSLGIYTFKTNKVRIINDADVRMYEQLDGMIDLINQQLKESFRTIKAKNKEIF